MGTHYPSLRKGESLFQEFDAVDPTRFEHKTYAAVVREIGILKNRLYGKTKFDKLSRYNLANVCYVVVESGVMADHEAPEGWGLLVLDGDELRCKPSRCGSQLKQMRPSATHPDRQSDPVEQGVWGYG